MHRFMHSAWSTWGYLLFGCFWILMLLWESASKGPIERIALCFLSELLLFCCSSISYEPPILSWMKME